MKRVAERNLLEARTERQPKPDFTAHENRRIQLDSLSIRRPLIEAGRLHASLGLAVLQAYGPQSGSCKIRRKDDFGVTLLEAFKFDRLASRATRLSSVPVLHLEAAIRDNLPDSHQEPLRWIPVTGLLSLGSAESPVLALELAAPEIAEESKAIEQTIADVTGQEPRFDIIPHISIAQFPGAAHIPSQVFEAVTPHLPQAIHLAPVATYSFMSHR